MCSRYENDITPQRLARRFGLGALPVLPNHSTIRPTDGALAILRTETGETLARMLRWGLQVDWDSKPLINARAETIAERPTFRRLLDKGRILLPASAYWEWRSLEASDGGKRPGTKARIKMKIGLGEDLPFAMAGLRDGERFTIVTCAPTPDLAAIHDRMPVILTPDSEAAWLAGADPAEVLRPYEGRLVARDDPDPPRESPPPPSPRQGDLFG